MNADELKNNILDDAQVNLTDEFKKSFRRKAFFSKAWKPRKDKKAKGSLLVVKGHLRDSIKDRRTENGIRYTSSMPYATIHNEGGKGRKPVKSHHRTSRKGKRYVVRAHTRVFNMPQRQFIGDGPETREIFRNAVDKNLKKYNDELAKLLQK